MHALLFWAILAGAGRRGPISRGNPRTCTNQRWPCSGFEIGPTLGDLHFSKFGGAHGGKKARGVGVPLAVRVRFVSDRNMGDFGSIFESEDAKVFYGKSSINNSSSILSTDNKFASCVFIYIKRCAIYNTVVVKV